jgi:hypothetical protein
VKVTATEGLGAAVSHALAAAFFAVSVFFVWRSFYGMRIGGAREEAAAAQVMERKRA